MREDGYDFRFISHYFKKSRRSKRPKRSLYRVYLRFHCKNPIHQNKIEEGKKKSNRFTTSKGTALFSFIF